MDLKHIIEIIFLLPGKNATQIRKTASELFIRFLGGDTKLISEVIENKKIQEHLQKEDPTNWRCVFGKTVNEEYTDKEKTNEAQPQNDQQLDIQVLEAKPKEEDILHFDMAPERQGAKHLYAFQSMEYPNIFKTGISTSSIHSGFPNSLSIAAVIFISIFTT